MVTTNLRLNKRPAIVTAKHTHTSKQNTPKNYNSVITATVFFNNAVENVGNPLFLATIFNIILGVTNKP